MRVLFLITVAAIVTATPVPINNVVVPLISCAGKKPGELVCGTMRSFGICPSGGGMAISQPLAEGDLRCTW